MKRFTLDNHPKIQSGLQAPDGYFDTLSARILDNLPAHTPRVIPFYRKKMTWIASAAAVLVLALMIPFLTRNTISSDTIDATSIENYLSYQSNLSQYDLIDLLDDKDVKNIDIDLALDDKAVEEYLAQNNNVELYLNE